MANRFDIFITGVDRYTAMTKDAKRKFAGVVQPVTEARTAVRNLGKELGFGNLSKGAGAFARAVGSASKEAAGLSPELAIFTRIGAAGGAAGGIAALAAAVGFMTVKWANFGFDVKQTSLALGESAQTVQAWRGAGMQLGLDAKVVDGSMQSLGDTIEGAFAGRNNTVLALMNRLGVTLKRTKTGAIDVNDEMLQLADVLQKFQGRPQVQRLIAEQFGIDPQMLAMMRDGRVELQKRLDFAAKNALSDTDIDAANKFDLMMKRWEVRLKGDFYKFANFVAHGFDGQSDNPLANDWNRGARWRAQLYGGDPDDPLDIASGGKAAPGTKVTIPLHGGRGSQTGPGGVGGDGRLGMIGFGPGLVLGLLRNAFGGGGLMQQSVDTQGRILEKLPDPNQPGLGGPWGSPGSAMAGAGAAVGAGRANPTAAGFMGGPFAKTVADYFRSKGVGAENIQGIVAGMYAEGVGQAGPDTVNPTSGAYGIGQLLGPRKRALFAKYGPRPTLRNQLDNMWSEMTDPGSGERGNGAAILGAPNSREALRAYIERYMRPGPGTAGDLSRGADALASAGGKVDVSVTVHHDGHRAVLHTASSGIASARGKVVSSMPGVPA